MDVLGWLLLVLGVAFGVVAAFAVLLFCVVSVLGVLMYIGKGAEWLLERMVAAQEWFDRKLPKKGMSRWDV